MYKGIAVACLVIGVIMIIWGINASESFASDVSRFFTGSPTERAAWLLLGGIGLSIIGLFGIFKGPKGG